MHADLKLKVMGKQVINTNKKLKAERGNGREWLRMWMPWVWSAGFALMAWWYLIWQSCDVLYMAQSRGTFYFGEVFWRDCMELPGGGLTYVGSFLTQLFYYPALGGWVLIGLWLLIGWLTKRAWDLRGELMPLALVVPTMLLVSVTDVGYWVYYMKFVGYFFVPTLGFLCVVAWAALRLPRKGLWTVVPVLAYPLLGCYSLLAMVATGIGAVKGGAARGEREHGVHGRWYLTNVALPLVLAVVTPLLWYRGYNELALLDAWTVGLPRFEAQDAVSWALGMPFVVSVLWIVGGYVVLRLHGYVPMPAAVRGVSRMAVGVVVAVALVCAVHLRFYDDYNYRAEMRMYRAAEEFDWDGVLREAARVPGDATRQMVLLKNVALFNKGTEGSEFFHYNNMGKPPYVRDSLKVHMVQTAAPLLYMHHGKTNFSVRWCVENSVEYGFSYNDLRILALSALLNEEYRLARKYLDVLSNTMFQRKWAERYLPATEKPWMLNERNIGKYYPELANIADLRRNMGSVLDSDNGLPEMYLINYFSHSMNKDSKLFNEMTLIYAMVQKDIQLFWPRFMQYAVLNADKDMPIHYQEAAYLYGKLEPQSMDTSRMPFDDARVVQRYERFNQTAQQMLQGGMQTEQVGEALKSTFGDTFWWFYFFCRDVKSY